MLTFRDHEVDLVDTRGIFPAAAVGAKKETSCPQSYCPLIRTVLILPSASILLAVNKYVTRRECLF